MNIPFYIFISVIIMMIWRFSLSTNPNNFGLMQMIGTFIVGGIMGFYLDSTLVAILASVGLSLIFI